LILLLTCGRILLDWIAPASQLAWTPGGAAGAGCCMGAGADKLLTEEFDWFVAFGWPDVSD